MKRISTFLSMFLPAIGVVLVFLGWILIASFENYFLITLYPLYASAIIGIIGMVKYQERELYQTPVHALKTELKIFPIVIVFGAILIILCYVLRIIAFEILIIPALVLVAIEVRVMCVRKALSINKERSNH